MVLKDLNTALPSNESFAIVQKQMVLKAWQIAHLTLICFAIAKILMVLKANPFNDEYKITHFVEKYHDIVI